MREILKYPFHSRFFLLLLLFEDTHCIQKKMMAPKPSASDATTTTTTTENQQHHHEPQQRIEATTAATATSTSSPSLSPSTKIAIVRRHTTIEHVSPTKSIPPSVNYISFACGLTAGVLQAGLFNPFDRALYLSVTKNRPFLLWENFQNPYLGFFQSVSHRALSGGLYFPLEHFFMTVLVPSDTGESTTTISSSKSGAFYNFLAGTAAGSANAVIVNPVSAVKYKTWGRKVNNGMLHETLEMLRKGGIRPFFNGLVPTVLRDLVFGGTYTFLRFEIQYKFQLSSENQWTANFVAAALATVVSGPFNLARNIQYATKSRHVADTVGEVMNNFQNEISNCKTIQQKLKLIQTRLRLGWGTARVAVGMTFGHYVYDKLHGLLYIEEDIQGK